MPGCRAAPPARMMSPSGGSILITSAPRSPKICVVSGPSTTAVRSITVTPASGPVGGGVSAAISQSEASGVSGQPQIAEPAEQALADLDELQGQVVAPRVEAHHAHGRPVGDLRLFGVRQRDDQLDALLDRRIVIAE